jgi:fructan beta-fructosidase
VLDTGKKNFRDPKVFWYGPEEKWVMVVSVPLEYKVQFYQSKDLTDWQLTGEFGREGDTSKIWECPDLLLVPVENSNEKKWVLIISSGSKYGDFTGMQYFTGNFDGQKFVSDQTREGAQWLDHGKDFYAAITYNNLSTDSKPLLIGWVNNWRYAGNIPTSPWRGMMSVPRELTLRNVNDKLCLIQKPVPSLDEWLNQFEKTSFKDHLIEENDLLLNNFHAAAYRMKLALENIDAEEFGIALLKGDDKNTILGYNVSEKMLFLDRKNSGDVSFHEHFSSVESVEVDLTGNQLDLDILVDRSVVEVFASNGYRTMTDQVLPGDESIGMQLYVKNGRTRVVNLELIKIH